MNTYTIIVLTIYTLGVFINLVYWTIVIRKWLAVPRVERIWTLVLLSVASFLVWIVYLYLTYIHKIPERKL